MSVQENIWADTKAKVFEFLEPEITALCLQKKCSREEAISLMEKAIDDQKDKQTYFPFSWYGSISDYVWLAYSDFFCKIKQLESSEAFEKMRDLMNSGIYDMVQLEDVCITCHHPEYAKFDERGRLHSEDTFAIKWDDGFSTCWWHGLSVPSKLIYFPEEITKEDLAAETNAEIRRCYQERLGDEAFAKILETDVIDESTDLSGRPLMLMRTKEKDPVAEEYICYIVVQDHSTPRKYWICVPETFTSAREALAWTAECDSWEEYSKLVKET